MKPPSRQGSPDDFQTPANAIVPLLQYIPKDYLIWECACGRGNLVKSFIEKGYNTIGTDILDGKDFLTWTPDKFDCIITNPPFSKKQEFLERCYYIGKPFALLLPLTTLETKKRQRLFKRYGVEIIFPTKRVNFETPDGQGSGSWFFSAWFTYKFNIGKELNFLVDYENQELF